MFKILFAVLTAVGLATLFILPAQATILFPPPDFMPPGDEDSDSGLGSGSLVFEADILGDQEVPAVVTDTTGEIKIEVAEDLTMADFKLEVRDGLVITQSHLHCGTVGVNGPVVAFLFGDIPGGFDVDGDLAEFTLTDANMLGISCGDVVIDNVAHLVQAIDSGMIYANVHSVDNPTGLIRGQLSAEED